MKGERLHLFFVKIKFKKKIIIVDWISNVCNSLIEFSVSYKTEHNPKNDN